MQKDILVNTFLDLVQILSSSGDERGVANYIRTFLEKRGWSVEEDVSSSKTGSNTGNLIARLHEVPPEFLFVAHMDTVQQSDETVKPTFKDGVFTSDGTTILGADNKASIAVLLAVTEELFQQQKKPSIAFAFTTCEEAGEMGSQFLDVHAISPKYVVNVDGSAPLGTLDYCSLGHMVFEINLTGRAAHAAIEPEKGVHVIKLIADLVKAIPLGKRADGSTVNLSMVKSEHPTNVVPFNGYVKGELRAYGKKQMQEMSKEIQKEVKRLCESYGADCSYNELFFTPPFEGSLNSELIKKITAAIEKTGHKVALQKASYTSDASYLSQHAIETVTLCKGGKNAHTKTESITLGEMNGLLSVIEVLIEQELS